MENLSAREIDRHVGARLRAARELRRLTLFEVGRFVGKNYQQIQKYETGANRISASTLWRLAVALDVPLIWFFQGLAGIDALPLDPIERIPNVVVRRHVMALAGALSQR